MKWYRAESTQKHVTQIVLCGSSAEQQAKSRFGILCLTTKFMPLLSNEWVTGFFYLDSDPGPFLLVRGDRVVSHLRGSPVTAAFCFYRMRAGGLVTMYVHVDCPAIAQRLTHPIVLFEIAYGLDAENKGNKEMIERAIERDSLHLCFAEGSGTGEHMAGGGFSSSGINAQYDVILPMPPECRAALKKEYDAILSYHSAVPASSRGYNASVQQMWAENPQGVNPILVGPPSQAADVVGVTKTNTPAPPNPSTATASTQPPAQKTSGRQWWQFWR
jgi:hypothetical protein